MKKIKNLWMGIVVLLGILGIFVPKVRATVYLQENFDDWPSQVGGSNIVNGWLTMVSSVECSDGHCSAEAIAPGRDGTGKSLKMWRKGGLFQNYSPGIYRSLSAGNNLFLRYYIKIPVEMDLITNVNYQKFFRFNTSGGEVYVGLYGNTPSMRNNGYMRLEGDGMTNTGIIDSGKLPSTIWDGKWHCMEFQFGLNNSTFKLWIDGNLNYNDTSFNWGNNTGKQFNSYLQHFPMGNRGEGSYYQSSWQALEVDDLVLADTYIGPAASANPVCGDSVCNGAETYQSCPQDCPAPDTQAPSVPSSLSASAFSSSQINLSWNASTDNTSVAGYLIYRNGVQVATTQSLAYQDTSLSPSTTYTYKVAAYDGAGNISAQSTQAQATTQAPSPTITIGETAILSESQSEVANYITAQSATLSQTATLQSLSLYVSNPAGKLRLGVYDSTGPNGGPGQKKAETAEINPITGWNSANVTTPISLPAGTYWLALLPSDNSLSLRFEESGKLNYYEYNYAALPNTFSTNPESIAYHTSFYATLNTGTGGDTVPPNMPGGLTVK